MVCSSLTALPFLEGGAELPSPASQAAGEQKPPWGLPILCTGQTPAGGGGEAVLGSGRAELIPAQ